MLDTEGRWSEALANNNIRAVIRWLQKITAEGDVDLEEVLPPFSHWVQRTSEFAKKELLTLCFSHCQGLWMFLDRNAFTRVHMLLQRLSNLLTLAQWARRHLSPAHLWHGMGVPCVVCRDALSASDVRHSCWSREQRTLKQHIWLGRLVQWWGIMGLLPKYPEANEVKRIAQMWKEMGQSHRKAQSDTPGLKKGDVGRYSSLIQGLVAQLDRQHGCNWTSEGSTDQCYPPPNLQALLKLVLVPHIDNMSVQALFMYFVLDVANFLQCKDNLLQSFCHAFTIPPSFTQQVRAFWMLDHGHIKASMELLLSPRAAVPHCSWQHRCIIHSLLTRKQPHLALRYLYWATPAIESVEDAKLCAHVLLQNSCVSEAWDLLRRGHTESNNMVTHFLQACGGAGLCAEAVKCIPAGYSTEGDMVNETDSAASQFPPVMRSNSGDRIPVPLSARLYQAQGMNSVSSEELVQLVAEAVMEVREPHPKISELVWPDHRDRSSNRGMFLSTQALRGLMPSPSPLDRVEDTEQELEEEQAVQNPSVESPEHLSTPSEDLSFGSVSSFTSVSSLPPLRRDLPYVYQSTLTLQRMSSLLLEGENQSREEEEEEISQTTSSVDALQELSELTMTLDGATDAVFLSSCDLGALMEQVGEGQDAITGFFPSEDFVGVDAVSEIPGVNISIDSFQLVPSLCEEAQSFLSPDHETTRCPHVTDVHTSAVSLTQADESDHIYCEISSFCEGATSDCFLEEESHQQEDAVGRLTPGLPVTMSDTSLDWLIDPQRGGLSEDPAASSSGGSVSILPPERSPICPTQSQQLSDIPLTPSLTCNITASSVPAESSITTPLKTDEPRIQGNAAWLDHCKMASWWRLDQGTGGASSGLLSASVAGAVMDYKKPPPAISQPYSHGMVMDFTVKAKGDSRGGKQADKEEPAGWSSLAKGSQGAIRSARTRARNGKRVKRT